MAKRKQYERQEADNTEPVDQLSYDEKSEEQTEEKPVIVPEQKKARYQLVKNGVGIFRDADEAKRLVDKEGWKYA